ncbi:MAG TPA: iron ABC transporter permease [Candidatus Limnocylindrales bacterium]|nr:iron ABC transporter permease [Candidatus Limnocylindrales bacterium]
MTASTAPIDRSRRVGDLPILGLIVGAAVLVMTFLVIYPVLRLIQYVFFEEGVLSLGSVNETLADPSLVPALIRTGILIAVATPLSVVIGAILAWLNERTDARMGWAADMLPIIPLLVPAIATAIGWVVLLAPRAGYLNALARFIFQGEAGLREAGPTNIYSAAGMIGVVVIVTVPLAYLTIAAAFRNMDPALEEASRMSGASATTTLRRVTLPAIRNAVATASVLCLIHVVSLFSVPVIIGSQGGFDVLSVLIYRRLDTLGGPRFDQMIVLSMFMLLTVQLAVVAEYAISRTGYHAKVGGKEMGRATNSLGVWGHIARGGIVLYVLAATVLPIAALSLLSLQAFWTPSIQLDNLSLDNYADVFTGRSALGRAFTNSLILGLATSTVLMLVAAVIAYRLALAQGWIARIVNGLTTLPASIPHVVTGVAFLLAFGSGRGSLQGTLILLFIAYLVMTLPQASRSAGAALSQVGREMWEASLMSGASQLRTFLRVLLPLMLPGLLAGWVIVFVIAFSETSGSVFLASPTANPVTGPTVLNVFRTSGTFPQIAALCLAVTAVQTGIVFVVRFLGRRR